MANKNKGRDGVTAPLPTHDPIARDDFEYSLSGPETKAPGIFFRPQFSAVLAEYRGRRKPFKIVCPICNSNQQEYIRQWVGPYLCEDDLPTLEKTMLVEPLSGGAFFMCSGPCGTVDFHLFRERKRYYRWLAERLSKEGER